MKQTAELFVGDVRADRRASVPRAERVQNCRTIAVKQTAELFAGDVRTPTGEPACRARNASLLQDGLAREAGLRGIELINEFLARHTSGPSHNWLSGVGPL